MVNIAQHPVWHVHAQENPIRVTSGSHVGHVQWYYCTTNKVRRKKAREPVVHAQSLPVPVISLPVMDASCDVISGHVTDVTSGHVTDVTSGSTTSHHLRKSGLSCTHILLVLSVCGSVYASSEEDSDSIVCFFFFGSRDLCDFVLHMAAKTTQHLEHIRKHPKKWLCNY